MKFAIPVLLLNFALPVTASAQINPEAEVAYENAMQPNQNVLKEKYPPTREQSMTTDKEWN